MMKSKSAYILPGILILAGIFAWGGGIALSSQTLSPRWGVLTAALALAVTTLPVTLRKTAGGVWSGRKIMSGIAHLFLVGGLGYFAILGINRLGATEDRAETVTGEVTQRLRHTHTRQRRIGRNRYIADGHYYTYGAMITLPDGRQTEQHLSLQEYNRIRVGSKRQVTVARGWLGMPVVIGITRTSRKDDGDVTINTKTSNGVEE